MAGMLVVPALALAALFVSIWPWTRLYDGRPAMRLAASLTATSAAVVGLQLVLGAAGLLAPESLGGAVAFVSVTSVLFWSLRADSRTGWKLDLARPTLLGGTLGALTLVTYAGLVWVGTLIPPYGWDTLVYHLTAVFRIAQTGGLEPFPHPALQFSFPLVGELHSSWFYLLSGAAEESWRVTGLGLVPLALTAGAAMRVAAEALELSRARSWIFPATLLVPLFLIQPIAGYVDTAFAAFTLSAFAFSVLAVREKRFSHLAFAALAGGLALGTKWMFVYFGIPILVVLASPASWRTMIGRRPLVKAMALLGLLAVGSGFWLARNVVRHANPVYPLEVAVGPWTLFEGPVRLAPGDADRGRFVDSASGWLAYPFDERMLGHVQYTVDNGFGPLFAAGLVALPLAILTAARRRRWLALRGLAALPLTLLIWLTLSPYEHPRYVLPACGFALLALAAVVEPLGRGPRRLTQAAIFAALAFSSAAGLANAAPELPQVVERWRSDRWQPRDYYAFHYGSAAEAFGWLARVPPPGSTLAFDRHLFVAPLFGWHGRNEVVYLAAPGDPDLGAVPFAANDRDWNRILEERGVGWFVVWREGWLDSPPGSIPERWLKRSPELFRPEADFGRYGGVYRRVPGVELTLPSRKPDLTELSDASGWVVEYRDGAEARLAGDGAGRLEIDYRFLTDDNDYIDLRFDLTESGWPRSSSLTFELEAPSAPTALWVYLKEADRRRECRFQVDLSVDREARTVRLDLRSPERQTPGFDPDRVVELHLVLDDQRNDESFAGSVRIGGFRLELPEETT